MRKLPNPSIIPKSQCLDILLLVEKDPFDANSMPAIPSLWSLPGGKERIKLVRLNNKVREVRVEMRAFVTGGTGFVGGHLVDELVACGWDVRALVRPTSRCADLPAAVEKFPGTLHDEAALSSALAGCDFVFHIAGITTALSPGEFDAVNAAGVATIARACAAQPKPPILVVTSSVAAAGPSRRNTLRTEVDREQPISDYGRSKLAGEQAARSVAAQVPVTIVRPGVVFGPRDRASLQLFSSIKKSGFHVYPRWRTPRLSVICVRDLARLLIAAAEHGERLPSPDDENASPGQGIYFACRDEFPTYHQFGWLAAQALGRRWFFPLPLTPPIPLIVGGVGQFAARLRRRPSLVNLDKMREATAPSWACSPAKAQTQLGFRSEQTLLEQMTAAVAWYRGAGWL